jgi:hypothetical protein
VKKLARLTALIGALVLAGGAPAYAHGGGGHGGGGGGGHAGGGFGGGHAFGASHGGFGGHHGFAGHRFHHDRFRGDVFIGFGPSFYGDPFWLDEPYGPYAYAPAPLRLEAPPVYIEKPQAGYCPSARASYPDVQSCAQPWVPVAPHPGG